MSKYDNLRKAAGITSAASSGKTATKGVSFSTRSVEPAREMPEISAASTARPVRPTMIMPVPEYDVRKSPLLRDVDAYEPSQTPIQDVIARGASKVANLPVIKPALHALGTGIEYVENLPGLKQLGGALSGGYNKVAEEPIPSSRDWMANARRNIANIIPQDAETITRVVSPTIQGALNPEAAQARKNEILAERTQGMGPVEKFLNQAMVQGATSPLSIVPVGGVSRVPRVATSGRLAEAAVKPTISELRQIALNKAARPAETLPINRVNEAPPKTEYLYRGQPKEYSDLQRVEATDAIDNILIGRGIFTTTSKDLAKTYGENVFTFSKPKDANKILDISNASESQLKSIMDPSFFKPQRYAGQEYPSFYETYKSLLKDGKIKDAEDMVFESFAEKYLPEGVTWQSVKNGSTATESGPLIDVVRDKLLSELTSKGFDFLKHKGGIRAGGKGDHDVYIALKNEALKRSEEIPTSRLSEPTPDVITPTAPVTGPKGDWYTRLFGDQQSLRFSPFGGRGSGRIITTEQQIVKNPLVSTVKDAKEVAKQTGRAAYQNFVDYLSPLKKISREVYDTAMDASRANNIANTIVRDKFVDLEGNVIGSSLNDVMAQSRGLGKKVDDYLILRHAVDRMRRGERVYDEGLNMTPEKAEIAVARLEQRFPQLKTIGQEWNNYNDNMLKSGVKEGLVSPEAYIAMRTANPNYAAMKRQFTTAEKFARKGVTTTGGFSGKSAPIHKVSPTGSTRKIVSPIRSAVEQTYAWKNAEMRNRTMQEIVKAIQLDPQGMKGIVEIVKKPSTSYQSLDDALRQGGSEAFLDLLNNDFKKLFQHAKPGEENIVRAMVKGKPVFLRVQDPEAVKTLLGMGVQDASIMLKTMQFLSKATKMSATGILSPMFAIKSFIGDTVQASIQSGNAVKHVGVDLPYAVISSIADVLKVPVVRKLAEDFKRVGGEYSYLLSGDKAANKSVRGLRREAPMSAGGVVKGLGIAAKTPFKVLDTVANMSENANRMAAFRRAMMGKERTPQNVRAAINAARESTVNFSRRGHLYPGMEALSPYMNAAIQSIYRLGKSIVKNPVKTLAGSTSLIIIPKLYEYAKFRDDPDYALLPARERYRNIIYSKNDDGTFNKAPMPMEYMGLAGFMLDVFDSMYHDDPQALKGSFDALANVITPPMVSGALQGLTQGGGPVQSLTGFANSTVAAPFAATIGNRSFTGAPIVPQSVAGFSTPYEYTEKTSGPAKYLGKQVGMSPMIVDYLLKQYTGDFGRLLLPLTSEVGAGTERATLFKNFIVDPAFTNTLTNDFYEASEKLTEARKDNLERDAPLPSWYNDDVRAMVTSRAQGSILKQLSDLSAEKIALNKDSSLNRHDKAQKLRKLQRDMNTLYIEGNMAMQKSGVPFPNR